MKKTLLVSLMIAALVGVFAASAALAVDVPDAPVKMEPTTPNGKMKYAPIMFDHAKHAATDCKFCHHKMDESEDMKCTTCHGDVTMKTKAYHDKKDEKSCAGCHKKNGVKGLGKGCNECHTK